MEKPHGDCLTTYAGLAPEVPWADIVGMRNILVHDYFGIDRGIVWTVVERDLPSLRKSLETLLEKCSDE